MFLSNKMKYQTSYHVRFLFLFILSLSRTWIKHKKLQTWNSWFLHYSLLQHIICSGLSFQVAHTFAYLIALINPDFQQEKKKKTTKCILKEQFFLDGIFKNRRDDILSYSIVKKMTPPCSIWFCPLSDLLTTGNNW